MLNQPKFKLGDRVTTNSIGPKMSGVIVGIANCLWFSRQSHVLNNFWKQDNEQGYFSLNENQLWIKKDPDCLNHPCYYIYLDEPCRAITLEEFLESNQLNMSDGIITFYERNIPFSKEVCHPEFDLSLCEVDCEA